MYETVCDEIIGIVFCVQLVYRESNEQKSYRKIINLRSRLKRLSIVYLSHDFKYNCKTTLMDRQNGQFYLLIKETISRPICLKQV